jgi:hypothetical protein
MLFPGPVSTRWDIAAGMAIRALFPPSVLGAAAAGGASGHLAKGMPRSEAKQLGDFIGPGQAGLVTVGESKVEDAIQHDVTRAEKQTAKELDVDPEDVDKACKKLSRRRNRARRGQHRLPGHPAKGAAASPASGVSLPDCCRRAHRVDRLPGAEPSQRKS